MNEKDEQRSKALFRAMDALHQQISGAQHELLQMIATADGCAAWRDAGAPDMAHWLSMRYGISQWKARRWIAAAHALGDVPHLSEALASGVLGIEKTVELARFATPETEAGLISATPAF